MASGMQQLVVVLPGHSMNAAEAKSHAWLKPLQKLGDKNSERICYS